MKKNNWLIAILLAAFVSVFPNSSLAVPGEETPCTMQGATVCEGTPVTLTAKLPPEYNPVFVEVESVEWTFLAQGSATPVTLPNTTLSITVTEPGLYSVSIGTSFGPSFCTATVTVNPKPKVTVPGREVCAGASALLTAVHDAGAGATFLWNTGQTTESIRVVPDVTTTYTVVVTSAAGCESAFASGTVVVNPNPSLTITGVENPVCAGVEVTLTAATDAANATFFWNTGETTPSITFVATTTRTFSVNVMSAAGCTVSGSATVTVNALPIAAIAAAEICAGSKATLTVTHNAGPGATFLWNTGETTQSIEVSPSATTSYSAVVKSAAGCESAPASGSVVVNLNPSLNIVGAENPICAGTEVTLTATTDAGVSFHWSTGETTPSITVTPTATTTYSVNVTSAAGCTVSGNVTVTVNALPVASVAGAEICAGSTTTLSAAHNAGPGATFVWNTGEATQTIQVSPSATTTYSVVVKSAAGCESAPASAMVIVNPNPTVAITGAETPVCAGTTVTLTANSDAGAGATYLWNIGATGQSITVNPTATTTYKVKVMTAKGCSAATEATVTVNPSPLVTVNHADICLGGSVVLTATTTAGSILWSTGETTPSITVSPMQNTSYTVTVMNEFGCTATATANVTLNEVPPTLEVGAGITICNGDGAELVAQTDATQIEWSTGETTARIIVTPTVTTTYTVTVGTDECAVTKQVTVTVKQCVSNPGTGTPGYWMNHPKAWPVESIVIGGVTYAKTAAIKLMKQSTSKDMTYVMFAHLVSAKLNVLIGNDSSCVSSTITLADSWMSAHAAGSKVTGSSAAWTQGEPWKTTLDRYNNGLLCAPHRD